MPAEQAFDQAVEDIANGIAVDWNLIDDGAGDGDEQESMKWLRVLGQIADLHRSADASGDEPGLSGSLESGLLEALIAPPASAPSDAAPASPAHRWGRFHLLNAVGEGSFGSVHRAWDPQLERDIAIKILHAHVAGAAIGERLLREGRALAKVRHPSVVTVLGVESHGGQIALCMDYVRGQTLEDLLRAQGSLPAEDVVAIGQDLCRALEAVHGAGLVHRDVKAHNVMREQTGRTVLMDFGTGRDARQLAASRGRDMSGTPLYMAPELLRGEPASASSDVYSLGVLLYYLAAGSYPIDASSLEELLAAHESGRVRSLAAVRPELCAAFVQVVERAIAADPDRRYSDAAALREGLAGVFPPAEPALRRVKRLMLWTLLLFAAGAASTVALGFLTSGAFNVALGRSAFASETLWDWWRWGLSAHVAPAVILALACIAAALVVVAARVLVTICPPAAGIKRRFERHAAAWARRTSLDQPAALGAVVLLLSSATLVSVWWYFAPLLSAIITKISTASPDRHAVLAPGFATYQNSYWQALSCVIIVTSAGWYAVLRLGASAKERVSRGLLAGGAAVMALTLASLDLPYRLIVDSEFEAAWWNGAACYVIGERAHDVLVFCPDVPTPRNRVLPKDSVDLQRLGRRESIFAGSDRILPAEPNARAGR